MPGVELAFQPPPCMSSRPRAQRPSLQSVGLPEPTKKLPAHIRRVTTPSPRGRGGFCITPSSAGSTPSASRLSRWRGAQESAAGFAVERAGAGRDDALADVESVRRPSIQPVVGGDVDNNQAEIVALQPRSCRPPPGLINSRLGLT